MAIFKRVPGMALKNIHNALVQANEQATMDNDFIQGEGYKVYENNGTASVYMSGGGKTEMPTQELIATIQRGETIEI